MTESVAVQPDMERLQTFVGKVMGDIGGALALLLSYIGDQSGVFRALRDHGPCSSAQLAQAAGVDERYLREWLSAMAAGGYVVYQPADDSFALTPEQAIVLAAEGHPACMQGFFQAVVSQFATHEQALDVFRSGAGRPWSSHHGCFFCGTDRFFRAGYAANLVDAWLPALDGVVERLHRGARVADVGCGYGSSAVLMAQAFPASTIVGFDFHAPSIEAARAKAAAAGVGANTEFVVASAKQIGPEGFDLVCMFDALHDMGDPVGVARRVRECLAPGGTFMLVEPLAGDRLQDNLHLPGQLFYSMSTLVCTPTSRAQEVGLALGAQAGEQRLAAVLREAGFSRIRRVAETATNMVLEVRV